MAMMHSIAAAKSEFIPCFVLLMKRVALNIRVRIAPALLTTA